MNVYKYRGAVKPAFPVLTVAIIFASLLMPQAIITLIPGSGVRTQSKASAAENKPENVKHVLYVNSYHAGYRWSDQVYTGISVYIDMGHFLNELAGKSSVPAFNFFQLKRYSDP